MDSGRHNVSFQYMTAAGDTSLSSSAGGRPPAAEASPSHSGSSRARFSTFDIARRLARLPSFLRTSLRIFPRLAPSSAFPAILPRRYGVKRAKDLTMLDRCAWPLHLSQSGHSNQSRLKLQLFNDPLFRITSSRTHPQVKKLKFLFFW